mgnify:CR=1 FL=1
MPALASQRRLSGSAKKALADKKGELNQIVHLWAYTDLNERAERRAQLLADAGFKAYVAKMLPLLQRQETRILRPAPFFKPLWREPGDSA